MMSVADEICFALASWRNRNRRAGDAGENPHTFDATAYRLWREQELRQQFLGCFDSAYIAGRDVLDFGCGTGELTKIVAAAGARSVCGVEAAEDRFQIARASLSSKDRAAMRFVHAADTRVIPVPSASADVILCFDVLEHVMEVDVIMDEWLRVLRPRGMVLIWWVPWWHPYGPHIESLIPIPWAHVFFSDRTLLRTCARIYESPNFRPRHWDLDEQGIKKPNKWTAMTVLPDVNRLSMRRFEAMCRTKGFRVEERRLRGFGSSILARATQPLLQVPGLREFFTSSATYVLRAG